MSREAGGPGAVGSGIEPRLCHRIETGVGQALQRHRSGFSEQTDVAVLRAASGLVEAYALIPDLISPVPGHTVQAQAVDEAINVIARLLGESSARFRAALYRPLAIITVLEEARGQKLGLNHQWFAWCWTSEAVWRALRPSPGKDGLALANTDVEVLLPVAARQRLLALSEPYRGARTKIGFVPADMASHLFGTRTQGILLDRTRQARWGWAEFLGRHESLPALESAEASEIEAETDLLLFELPGPKAGSALGGRTPVSRRGAPLAINSKRLSRSHRVIRYSTEDIGFASGLIDRHLLPRYRVFATTHATLRLSELPSLSRCTAALTVVLAVLSVLAALVSPLWETVPFTEWSTLDFAAILAGATYGLGLAGVILHGRAWTLPWLLRVPAAATIGMFMVTTMHPSWWGAAFAADGMKVPGREDGPEPVAGPMIIAALLAAAAFAYLVTNVRNTGVGPFTSLARSALVWVIAAVHALLIALLGLVWVVPVFSENGHLLREALTEYPRAAVAALLQAGAWCLIAGVFSQILWDDRPLTAPLTHAHWRSEQR